MSIIRCSPNPPPPQKKYGFQKANIQVKAWALTLTLNTMQSDLWTQPEVKSWEQLGMPPPTYTHIYILEFCFLGYSFWMYKRPYGTRDQNQASDRQSTHFSPLQYHFSLLNFGYTYSSSLKVYRILHHHLPKVIKRGIMKSLHVNSPFPSFSLGHPVLYTAKDNHFSVERRRCYSFHTCCRHAYHGPLGTRWFQTQPIPWVLSLCALHLQLCSKQIPKTGIPHN